MSSPAAPSVRHWQIVGGSAAAQPITGGAHEAWTLIGAEDTTIELVLDDDYAIIFKVGNTGQMQSAGDFQLQYEVNATGGFAAVNATSSNLRSAASGDTDDATSATERLSTSAQTFTLSTLDEVDGLNAANVGGGEELEFYFTFNLRGLDLTAGAESIELRITTGGATFDHTAVEPILITLPALSVPPGAYLPVPKANWVESNRALQTLELNEYPQPPPPVSVVAETPALKANRVRADRQIQALPRLPEYPLPAAVAVPYPSWLPPLALVSLFDRERLKLPQLDEYPATPVPPVSVVAETPTLKANRIEFERVLQTPLELNERPTPAPVISTARSPQEVQPFITFDIRSRQFKKATPVAEFVEPLVAPVPYPSWLPPVANRVSFERRLQALPQLDERPATPPGFRWPRPSFPTFTVEFVRVRRDPAHNPAYPATPPGFRWPRPPMPTLKASFERTLQTLAQNPAYPPTPPGFFEGFFPAPVRLKRIPLTYPREAQSPLELNERPSTPPGFFEGHWPAPVPMPTHRVAFTRTLQILGIPPEYPETPVSAVDYPGLTPASKANRISFERHIQAVELDERPPTPPGFFEGFFPAPIRLKRIPTTYGREAQVPLELNERPPTPVGFFDGFYPGSKRVESFKVSFERELQTPLEINVYPPPPVSAEDYAGYTPVAKFSWSYQRRLQTLELNERPETPPGFRWPRPSMPTHRTAFARRLQLLPQLDERPETPAPTPPQPRVEAFNVSFTRARQELAHNPIYPPTQAGFFDGFWPGSRRVEASLVKFTRILVKLPQHDEWPQIPPVPGLTAFFRVKDANKSAFDRRLLLPPVHNEYPETPPSIIEGMAMWPAVPIYRRDIKRSLQPVWDPGSVVGKPVFIPHDDDCKVWLAECAPTTWTADSTWVTWEADPICN